MKLYGKMAAFAAVVLTLPMFAVAKSSPSMQSTGQDTAGQPEALQMVSTDASLMRGLDAKKVHDGYEIRAKLSSTARLKNGTKLPSGTILVGHVVQDETNQQGLPKLALRFDQADLKNGKVIPIKATLVGIAPARSQGGMLDNGWSARSLQIDEIDALPGVDLHSRIADKDSGVLVSTRKDDVKLSYGSQLEFAIAPKPGA